MILHDATVTNDRRHRVDSSWANGNVAATHLPS